MNYEEALNYINDLEKFGSRPGLREITKLMDLLDNPQKGLKIIHVGGTNGKGSTTSYISNMLQKEGYKVGVFTSPYLVRFNERIAINHEDIPNQKLADITERIKNAIPKMIEEGYDHPTTFEIITAISLIYFKEEKVDYVVYEVGLGGKEDSTNVIESPLAAVLTTIDYDHIDVLGSTLKEIAYQKAGIIKEDTVVISYPQQEEAKLEIEKAAENTNSKLFFCPLENITIKENTDIGSVFDFKYEDKEFSNLKISLLGEYQIYNATMAMFTMIKLRELGRIKISDESIVEGLSDTRWGGRLEIISENPRILIDGAHNVQGANTLKEALSLFNYKRLILGFSVLVDKDYKHIIEMLIPLADKIVLTEIPIPRKMPMTDLENEVKPFAKGEIFIEKDNFKALEKSMELYEEGDLIVFAGSLYLIGNIKREYIDRIAK